MPIEDTAPQGIGEMLEPLVDGKFNFACHPGVPCFTECCRDLKLLLTPYDILKLKKRLGLQARAFLDLHTETAYDEQRHLPMVYLRMQQDNRRTCPFVSPAGCTVYEDRPSACRIYPIARASRVHRTHRAVIENFFILRERHCRGFEKGRTWSIREWLQDQGLDATTDMNNRWMDIVTHPRLRESSSISSQQRQMFFLASYNMDQFRDFVFKSRFLSIFDITDEDIEAMRLEDEPLLALAFNWLKFSLVNEPGLVLRESVKPASTPESQ